MASSTDLIGAGAAHALTLAGIPFEVFPASLLEGPDLAFLDELERNASAQASPAARTVRLELTAQPGWTDARPEEQADFAPAHVDFVRDRLHIRHRRFLAEVDPAAARGRLWRAEAPSGLGVALRIALCAALPELGGLPLHAAGIVDEGRGLVFFGPSGAGKSTLAATRAAGVLSDELVAVVGPPWRLVSTGFWGSMNGESRTPEAPLTALVELAKGPAFHLERLAPAAALRRILGTVLVPPAPPLWRVAMGVLGRLVHDVPVYRMHWSPAQPPWPMLAAALASRGGG